MTSKLLFAAVLLTLLCFVCVYAGVAVDRAVKRGRMELYALSTTVLMFIVVFVGLLTAGGAIGFWLLLLGKVAEVLL